MARQPSDLKVIEVRGVQLDDEECVWKYKVVWSSGLITTEPVECFSRLDSSAVQGFTNLLFKLRKEPEAQPNRCSTCRVAFDGVDELTVHLAHHKSVQEFLSKSNEWDFKLIMEEATLEMLLTSQENHLEYAMNDVDFSGIFEK
ncbi:hypothetical protein GCK72_023023 [Caenorhabditis remanei]|uniref:C2H2-type domain-containing protein n=1 Tax=Caenorhabditis remanei TaxID=31234 RepID=A0A6A5FVK2_CAERE|nr:hypothetical protein GCK72_023023 [Caenorhabditis remanei]KAF1746566.1 hypothetical protein GCK72_023023 [Caenorhabditis remanei]